MADPKKKNASEADETLEGFEVPFDSADWADFATKDVIRLDDLSPADREIVRSRAVRMGEALKDRELHA